MKTSIVTLLVAMILLTGVIHLQAQNTVVTYQGLVQSGGSDFTGAGQFKFALVTTTNTSAQATAVATSSFITGQVTGINVTFGGSGYVTPPTVTLTGVGSGATATAIISDGVVTGIQVNNPGTGYTFPPAVTIAPPPPVLAYLTHWSNDGTSVNGSEPTAAVTLAVNNALFTARLGDATVANMTAFGAGLFTQPNLLLRIWFGDGTNGMALLVPPQPLTAAPYAAVAGGASSLLGGTYSNAVTFNNPANNFSGSGAGLTGINAAELGTGTVPDARLSANVALRNANNNFSVGQTVVGTVAATTFSGSGANLTALNASQLTSGTVPNARLSATVSLLGQTIESSEITDGTIQAVDVNAASFNTTFWRTAGNAGTTAGTHFLGTTDNQPVEIKVNGLRALRIEDNGDGSDSNLSPDGAPNLIGGSPANFVGAGVVGATIAGGGATNFWGAALTNSVLADFGVVGGGYRNTIAPDSEAATIAGGRNNDISTNAIFSAIGGGNHNTIWANSRSATIAGGSQNDIGAYSEYSAIGGGYNNNIVADSSYNTIAGGYNNYIGTNSWYSAIGGGYINTIAADSEYATIAGGANNDIGANSDFSAIGGGFNNNIAANSQYATIAGGRINDIGTNSTDSAIGGGYKNNIAANSQYATIAGGGLNDIGTSSTYSAIGGGSDNNIAANSLYATIPGGHLNAATNYAFAAGRRAKANHQGAFVWGDSTDANIASTANNQFLIRATGGVGIGETAPQGQLHITGGAGTPQIKIETTANNSFVKLRLESFGKAYWDFAVGGSGNVMNWYYSGTEQNLMWLSTAGTLTTAGPVNPPSDRNVKQDFATVDPLAVLEKVAALPIQSWAYKNSPDTRHIGPVAQDFHAAFQFNGDDDKHISTVDADGVALAAIQGLNQKLEAGGQRSEVRSRILETRLRQKESEISEMKRHNQSLEQRLAALERVLLSKPQSKTTTPTTP